MPDTLSPLAGFLGLLVILVSGCVDDVAVPPAHAQEPSSLLVDNVERVTWTGHLLVGAGRELPAHLMPFEQYVAPVWRTGFVVEILEAPDILEVRLDWTSAGPIQIMMMTHAPHGAERPEEPGWSEYSTQDGTLDYASASPLCMRLPAKDLAEDLAHVKEHGGQPHWYPMAHSLVGLDVGLRFTVSSVGGTLQIPDTFHGHTTNAEALQDVVETTLGPHRAYEECALGLPSP